MIYWNSLSDFLAMGGYGGYVWGSFGLTALIVVLEPALLARQRNTSLTRLRRQWQADQGNRSTPKDSQTDSDRGS